MYLFKNYTHSIQNPGIKKLIMSYGAIGYAVYVHSSELIVADINRKTWNSRLDPPTEIIVDNLKIEGTLNQSGVEIVEEILGYILDLGLFSDPLDEILKGVRQ